MIIAADSKAFPPRTAARLAIDYVPISRVTPDPRNARVHSRKQIRQIAASIETFGFNVPILIDADLNIIAGHGAWPLAGICAGPRSQPSASTISPRPRNGPS
jgi:ParB-like nuclease domain